MVAVPRLVIAAPASGCGKTTVACGLMAAFRSRGLDVSGHKVGPDYIDPGYHERATGRPRRNLDPFLCGPGLIAPLFLHGAEGADVAVIEGVMGLFDGVDPALGAADPGFGSTAHVARLLDAPVVLVLDAARAGRSVAAVAAGFSSFDPRTRIAGVILNQVASDRHERLLRDALGSAGIPVYGAIRRTGDLVTPSRHLGLVPAAERQAAAGDAIARMGALIAASCDLDGLLTLARRAPALPEAAWDPAAALTSTLSAPTTARASSPPVTPASATTPVSTVTPALLPKPGSAGLDHDHGNQGSYATPQLPRSWNAARGGVVSPTAGGVVAVAGGAAFTFGYTEQVELLTAAGLRVAPFDPLRDEDLPEDASGLLLGGGFPEMYAADLSANERLRKQVAVFAASGAPVVAECAGLLYLSRTLDGHPMCGVLGVRASMTGKLTLGYRRATATADWLLASAGERVHGHEFHRTATDPAHGDPPAWRFTSGPREGHVKGPVIASYLHVHWAGYPALAARFARACAARYPAEHAAC
ncbi:MAG: cobyrinate a,c-diamide synthase [Streptosporangiaceae bacterium]|nr:cobyrinate a,c-diamide synthase [Streptosporangiaceae bacterium]MBV9854632.1 cobyrinate a,c-diamide synthase [Streptosporangiaceae bacterium]